MKPEKQEQNKTKASRRKEKIKIRRDISESKNRKTKEKSMKLKAVFLYTSYTKINKFDKPPARVTKKKSVKLHISGGKRGENITYPGYIKR